MAPAEALKLWEETIHKIKEARPNLGSYLEQGAVTNATLEKITLGYPTHSGFLTDLISKPDNRKFINDVLSKIFPKPPGLEIRTGTVNVPAAKPDRGPQIRQNPRPFDDGPPDQASKEPLSGHPRVQEVLQIFGGQVVELKKEEG